MREIREVEYPAYGGTLAPHMSWGAIIAGALLSFMVMSSLFMLGAGIGLVTSPEANSGANLAKGLGVGGSIWLLFSAIISFYAGGWVTGRLSGIGSRSQNVIHGVLSWAASVTVWLFFVTTALSGAFGGAFQAIGSTIGIAGDRVAGDPRAAAREVRAETGVTKADVKEGAEKAAKTAGAVGIFGFLLMLVEALSAGYGAAHATRLLRPKAVTEYRETPPTVAKTTLPY